MKMDKTDILEIIDQYAQKCVDDMDVGTLMEIVKEGIETRLTEMEKHDALKEIRESVYAEEVLHF